MTRFVRCRHEGVEGEALLPVSALHIWTGWEPVDPTDVAPDVDDLTVPQVLDEVGDDPVKAAAALEAERAGKNRRSLIDRLTALTTENQE